MTKLKEKIIFVFMGLIIVLLILQTIQIAYLNSDNKNSSNVNSKVIDMGGWSDEEIMMYEHHGTLPTRIGGSSQPSSGMVGGC